MSYSNMYIVVYANAKNQVEKHAKNLEERRIKKNPISTLAAIASNFEAIAVGEYLLKDSIASAKNIFYNSAKVQELAFNWFDSNPYGKPSEYLSMMSYRTLLQSIISDNKEQTIRIAELMGGRGKVDYMGTNHATYNFGYALKHIVLDEYVDARGYVNEAYRFENSPYTDVLNGIILSDNKLVKNALKESLRAQKRSSDIKYTPSELFSTAVIALAKLAQSKGFDIDMDDEIAPKEFIKHTIVDYSPISFLKGCTNLVVRPST